MHRVHSFSVFVGSAGSPLPPGASVVTLRLLSYLGFCCLGLPGGVGAGVLASGLPGGVVAGVLSPALPNGVGVGGLQHAASEQPGHAFAKAPTRLGSKPGGAAASGAAGATCPPLPMGQRRARAPRGSVRATGHARRRRAAAGDGRLLARQPWSRSAARSPFCAALSSLTVLLPVRRAPTPLTLRTAFPKTPPRTNISEAGS